MKVIIIVPCFNEEATIRATVEGLLNLRQQFMETGHTVDIYVVDDGSTDATQQLARSADATRVLSHSSNRGLGAAVRTGLIAARADEADIAVKFDADLQHDPNDVLALIRPIVEDEADLVYGDRFGRVEYKMPFSRVVGNKLFTFLMRWLTSWPLRDAQPGIFAAGRAYLTDFYLPGDYNYTQQILLDAYHKGMRFAHVPVVFKPRAGGKSFVSYAYPFRVLPQIIQVLVGVKPLRFWGTLGLFFLAVGGMVFVENMLSWLLGYSHRPVRYVNLVLGCAMFGLQLLSFGLLADLIIKINRRH